MKRTLPPVLFLLCTPWASAQPYGNEWINFGRQYWRFEIRNEGIFRIDSAALAAAGFPVGAVDPREIQLFNRQKQVPLYVEGEYDGAFNSTDFLEFHAKGNDAWLDVGMWDDPAHVNNPYHSQINDSIRFFLTWAAAPQTLRVKPYANPDIGSYFARDWFVCETHGQITTAYQRGQRNEDDATNAWMVEGEGWFNASNLCISGTCSQTVDLLTYAPYPSIAMCPTTLVLAGANASGAGMVQDHHVRIRGGAGMFLYADTMFKGYQLMKFNFPFYPSELTQPYTTFSMDILHDMDSLMVDYPDRQAFSWLRLLYRRQPNMVGQTELHVYLPDDPGEPDALFDFYNFPGTPVMYVFNGDTVRRVVPISDAGHWKGLLPADPMGDTTHAYVYTQANIDTITAIEPVTASGYFTDFATVNGDSALLIVSDELLMNGALQYASYRETSQANPMPTVVADVDELYDQYGGGVERHPLSIRRWCDQMQDQSTADPRGLFLIGKSVQAPRVGTVPGHRILADSLGRKLLHVPTFGYPPSDVCFTLGLQGDDRMMEIPVGRLAARDEQDVLAYLDKVQVYEGYPLPEKWMKNILHFRGGFDPSEWAMFGAALNSFKVLAEDTSFAGRVTTFVKNDAGILDMASADSVRAFIEEGVTLMTFFAHASGSGFDINIDDVNNYEWNGHYPAVIGNSCYAGNLHLTGVPTPSEDFVLTPEKGAIAFLANVDIGFATPLQQYTREYYRSFSQVNYGGSIGSHMKHAVFQQLNTNSDVMSLSNCQTFTLHGDPSLVMNSWDKADFLIEDQDLILIPGNVTADIDSFQVAAHVRNIGRGTNQPVVVSLTRTLSNGTSLPPKLAEAQLHYEDTVTFTVPVMATENGLGQNHLEVRVDLDPDEIVEHVEVNNNIAGRNVQISSGDILPVWPYEFAIIPDAAPVLKASTVDPLAPPHAFVFQIDTTDSFDSPVMQGTVINAPGGVVSWSPPGIFSLNATQDSTVFFWRCSRDSSGGAGYQWNESSFQYIEDREGWGQAHIFQRKNNAFNSLVYDKPDRRTEFYQGQHNIRAYVKGNSSGTDNNLSEWYIDLDWQDGNNGCGSPAAFMVCVVDPVTFDAWGTPYIGENPTHDFGQQNAPSCRPRVENFFVFRQNVADQMDSMAIMLQNEIPDGHYVIVYTWKDLFFDVLATSDPDNSAINAMLALGAPNLTSAPDSVPYIFFVRKGYPATAQDTIGENVNSYINLSVWVDSQGNVGQEAAPYAGPALDWSGLYWNEVPMNANDSTRIRVTGRNNVGAQIPLMDLESPMDSLPTLGVLIDPAEYPWLKLSGWFFDYNELDPVPAQLERWQLLYAPAPEAALDPPSGYHELLDSLYEGTPGRLAIAVRNISPADMDSMLVTAWVTDRNNVTRRIHYRYNAPLPVGAVLMDTIIVETEGLAGLNLIRIEANPIDTLTGLYDQLEQYHFNNIAELRFDVLDDDENPVLDVTFDGIHILDNDVVSARPEIQITLDDDNEVLLLDEIADTSRFSVYLTDPDGHIDQIRFIENGLENLQWVPADGPDNICKIFFRPVLDRDGVYVLRVQGKDLSNNDSGDEDYEVRFEVVNRPTITNVLNYPNPFTTSTRFVFTLTGTEIPTAMKIQIYTVSGRVIRTIDLMELGPIHVGRNITTYAWDGTDDFGDKLARGVYLYKVYAQLHGQDIEHRETAADGHFTKGFGKMYLLR